MRRPMGAIAVSRPRLSELSFSGPSSVDGALGSAAPQCIRFLRRMHQPDCVDLFPATKSFVLSFSLQTSELKMEALGYKEFVLAMETASSEHPRSMFQMKKHAVELSCSQRTAEINCFKAHLVYETLSES